MALYKKADRLREIDKQLPRDEKYRTEFRQDYGRLIHSAAFRRLAGKTQLFPGLESDFFRNRLTHSLEVAQVAKSIANKLNEEQSIFKPNDENNWIDTDLVETAALAHDLGHPPFGHNGEEALDECMRLHGGFEGNAQTLRILSRLEKKVATGTAPYGISQSGKDDRHGLNLTYRTLAAVLKYDRSIAVKRTKEKYRGPIKGYYRSEKQLVDDIKKRVTGGRRYKRPFKTLECRIMDISDDIAYSTYDLEDAFKAGFLTPLDLVSAPNDLLDQVVKRIPRELKMNRDKVRTVLIEVFYQVFDHEATSGILSGSDEPSQLEIINSVSRSHQLSKQFAEVGYLRTELTSKLVGQCIAGIRFEPDRNIPALSKVYLEDQTRKRVEVLKRFVYESLIMSPRLKVAELRGKEIVEEIFKRLDHKDGRHLLPDDYRIWYRNSRGQTAKKRVICDFIAGMTDRYAVEFFSRLRSDNPQSIFKPI